MIEGIGVDILEIEHLKRIIAFEKDKFLNYIFTDKEIKSIYNHNKKRRLEYLATSFTAKEACFKAISQLAPAAICFKEIEVLRNKSGKPQINFRGNLAQKFPSNKFHLFISSSFNTQFAISFVIVEKI